MKQKIKFQVSIEVQYKQWQVSQEFDDYDDAQAWRRNQERELLRQNPNRRSVNSNLLFNRYTIEEERK